MVLLAVCVTALWSAPARAAGEYLDQERTQEEVGSLSAREADGFKYLAEEMRINFGREKAAPLEGKEDILDEVAGRDVPAVLRRMRGLGVEEGVSSRRSAGQILDLQGIILAKIESLISEGVRAVEAGTLAERAKAVAEAERETRAKTRRLALETLGRDAASLAAQERAQLEEIGKEQASVTSQIEALRKSAREVSRSASAEDRARIEKALEESGLGEAREASAQAARETETNRLASAVKRQGEVIDSLDAFREVLEAGSRKPSREERLRDLTRRQRELASETSGLDSERDFAETAGGQRELADDAASLSDDLDDNPLAEAYARAASAEMEKAAESLSEAKEAPSESEVREDRRGSAAESQEKALSHLDRAAEALADPMLGREFAELSEELDRLQETASDLMALDELIEEQEALRDETLAASPDELGGLAPQQTELEGRAASMAESGNGQSEGGEESPEESGQPSDYMDSAAKSMAEAAGAMEESDSPGAAGSQEKALEEMKAARNGMAAAMAREAGDLGDKADLAQEESDGEGLGEAMESLLAEARSAVASARAAAEASELGEKQLRLAERTEGLPEGGEAQAMAPSQEALSEETGALEAESGEMKALAQSLSQARSHMDMASAALRGGTPKQARRDQGTAMSHLREAARNALAGAAKSRNAVSRSMTRNQEPGTRSLTRAAGSPGATGSVPGGQAWLTRLPPETPPDILQAASGAFPMGYEETLRRYYEAVAGESGGK